ncbi:ribosome biogenesis protein Nop16 [Sodiomyces alkalinus F11]|uniref:Nucleolar protein 16 n=1 Tax=Sodiomyces alkalinus (strain CBS 110278 / VKM F-3762 / F11) TaxID=1314773 RepID=A0A3N2PXM6_SODAK|nr:ribosome biogenesis protein Nop16 [Sodiomyces alkalinus F11]ROT39224.1 ribosome biogenesis protein Nop16 [Sodiomyces alkalinus F11]
MGRTLQNRKRRSGKPKIRQANKLKRPLNPRGNNIIAQNWNKKETLTQNYRRLGLAARLNGPSGGEEKTIKQVLQARQEGKRLKPALDPLMIDPTAKAVVGEAKIERDADGNIINIQYIGPDGKPRKKTPRDNPLNDPLVDMEYASEEEEEDDDEDPENKTEVIRLLEEEASRPVEKKPRHQSEREREWVERLVARHGDNFAAMARDRKLNPMQQTEADIARRIRKWQASH